MPDKQEEAKRQEGDKDSDGVIMNQIKKYLGYYKIIVGVVLAAIMLFYVVMSTNEIRTMKEGLKKKVDLSIAISNDKFDVVQGRFNNIKGIFEGRFDNIEDNIKGNKKQEL
ncbi:hypothetical protein GLOIN_2v1783343 [Rhizophagus irregularis DAOM 181602=DAOM 197198]|uniref:Uncharacterized protein n=1 Tax=Rhizophagus irregularis (strain DAOM 181602 / DAOM 197198 / MUCL 43194) TaxID=747089 RepID=A0A2P4PFB5_RHIID|nr:hypothetical protein GLOIN_2v1783343 [Rhizophagus irregularis DAOM 181602=DAOM 197198]POG64086.1 hypothetical protein GLOIN_2v1783343 [Rhizophagus irregularis DAOM 181602=DAOM 197198]GET53987.1 hypothetical protein GLOIN_2v1783343 [Rhizophagus irregularis DAOM 181602=DAOM 197198]CAG8645088.1 15176_t:CDS:2 [Rhizophagus irregularis]|eukprot:XP_025170952.1 hypothetical protein GLOIN_2v1783343 [Rhizophagus irregularis DAOM 181602=DAOM 197198]